MSYPRPVLKLIEDIEVPLSQEDKQQVENLLRQNLSIFALEGQPLGHTEMVQHDILTNTEIPIKQPVRRPPFHLRDEADKAVEKMLKDGVIEPSNSPWASPVVLVRKKDNSLRYCIDYRKLNNVTRKDSYPLPRIDDSLDSLGKAKYFSTLDLASGYWQIGLTDEARQKSAFCTTSGLYQFKVMPFGLTNAPATFQRLMEKVLAGLQWQICLVYIDDIIIYSQTLEEHLKDLQQIFSRLKQAKLKLKPKKCSLLREKVAFLGHVVSGKGIETDPDKIEAVKKWQQPTNLTELRSFIGFCSYYRRFIPEFAILAKPLIQLTEKGKSFEWTSAQDEAWTVLKEKLVNAPILTYPDRDATFLLDTDASNTGIGAVLSQIIDGEEKVIAYGSRVLSKAERNYCITRRELLAVVYFVKTYRHYLVGKKFILRTDHAALRWLKDFKEPEGQVARWIEVLDTYDYELIHRPGKKHLNADAMSRGPCAQCSGEHEGKASRRGRRKKNEENVTAVMTRQQKKIPVNTDAESNWLSSVNLNMDRIRASQQADPVLSQIFDWVKKEDKPSYSQISHEGHAVKFYWSQFDSLRIINGVVIREIHSSTGIKRQILLATDLRDEALAECHSVITAGHFGQKKSLANLRRRFIWPGMRRDMDLFILSCEKCQQYKTEGKKRRAALKDFRAGIPMERVCVDIVGPFPVSTNGNKYGLVVTDCFTKYVEIYPIPNQEAVTVATTLTKEFFSRYGVPTLLHTDQGTQFESVVFQETCRLLGIKKTRTTPFHPQSDGQSERNIKTLTRMIAMTVDEQHQWDEHLPFISMAYRATPQATTGLTPNYMMYGRELFMPVDIECGLPSDEEKRDPVQFAVELRSKLSYAYEIARTNMKKNTERQFRYYNQKQHGDEFCVGDLVWYQNKLRKKGVSPKLQPKWRGPCIVTRKFNDVLFEIQTSSTKKTVVHSDLLKPCHSTKLASWLRRAQRRLRK